MRTQEEIMTEVANSHSYETWHELMMDSKGYWQIHCTKEAMNIFAKEIADEALSHGYYTAKDEAKGITSSGYATRFYQKYFPNEKD